MHYVAVIDKDADSAYGVRFPDVPGCFSAADTFDEIAPNAIEALALFFEDREIVPARGIEAVREEVAEDLVSGAVLMMIPYIADRRRVVRVNLSLDKGLLDTLDAGTRHDPLGLCCESRNEGNLRSCLIAARPRFALYGHGDCPAGGLAPRPRPRIRRRCLKNSRGSHPRRWKGTGGNHFSMTTPSSLAGESLPCPEFHRRMSKGLG